MKIVGISAGSKQRSEKATVKLASALLALVFVLVSQSFVFCSAQPADTAPQPVALLPAGEGALKLTEVGTTGPFQFGLVRAGTAVQHDFTLRNETKQSLVLDRVAPSCHCTSAFVLSSGLSSGGVGTTPLSPGQTVQVRVNLETRQVAASETDPQGQVEKTVSVYVVGQPIHPAVVLTLSGRIASSAAFDPPLLDLGILPADQATRRTVRLFFASANARLAAAGDDRLRLRRLGITHLAGNEIQTYQVEVPRHAAAGPLSAAITVVGDTASTAALPVTGQIIGDVSASPPSVVFGVVPAEETSASDAEHRTRLILLSCPSLRPADAAAFWAHATVVQSPTSFWQADFVTLRLSSSTSRRLRVILKTTAPTGQWIASGLSQRELAVRLGLKEQQIQRYETTEYASASMARISAVIQASDVQVREEVSLADKRDRKSM